jgi:hypothetical protein
MSAHQTPSLNPLENFRLVRYASCLHAWEYSSLDVAAEYAVVCEWMPWDL